MKFICEQCGNGNTCELTTNCLPFACPHLSNDGDGYVHPDWNEVEETNEYTGKYACPDCGFEINLIYLEEGEYFFCKKCGATLLKGVVGCKNPVTCKTCAYNDETCSMCEQREDGSKWVTKTKGRSAATPEPMSKTGVGDVLPEVIKDLQAMDEPNRKEWVRAFNAGIGDVYVGSRKNDDIDQDYRPDSIVSNRKKEIDNLVGAHWNYMEKVILSSADKNRKYTHDEMMKIRKWDYTSSAIHFYGHGLEDKAKEFAYGLPGCFADKIAEWANDRGLYEVMTPYSGMKKLMEETCEWMEEVNSGDIEKEKMELGDIKVCLQNIANFRGFDLDECGLMAYRKIKDRTGHLESGSFVKDEK